MIMVKYTIQQFCFFLFLIYIRCNLYIKYYSSRTVATLIDHLHSIITPNAQRLLVVVVKMACTNGKLR